MAQPSWRWTSSSFADWYENGAIQGELIYGGLGSGLYSIVVFVLISVFVGGLMVGRKPEYLGKQVSIEEMKLIGLYGVLGAATVLILTALAVVTDVGLASRITNQAHMGLPRLWSLIPPRLPTMA